ncbi:YchJ family protein [Marinifilum sp. RC60d5]|uniref:YchJ family protein n=1 Tax=Marinifilum sp. RC60d5 TaxID=3458414 RepID=UPI0040368B72
MSDICYCGKLVSYENCCGGIHKGLKLAETAEELMRSRYAAFVTANIDYILNTYTPETRPVEEKEEILNWAKSVEWIKLEVLSTEKGMQNDKEGFVEFKAYYRENGIEQVLHENSFFRKENNNWMYVSGEYPKTEHKKKLPGRNDPCFCGSGKKYKKCCYGK